MKHVSIAVLTMLMAGFLSGPASAGEMMCAEADMSKMTTMIGAMADGPHKWQMYRHLAQINVAMSRDGTRGCDAAMADIMRRMHLAF